MALDHEWFSPTRATGIAADIASFLACGWGWWNSRQRSVSCRPFALLATVQLYLVLDMVFNWRWMLHDFGAQAATLLGLYSLRRSPQLAALGLLFLLTIFLSILILHRFRSRIGLGVAAISTSLAFGLSCCESISFHYVDVVLYHFIGRIMMVALLWASLALMTCIGVWMDSKTIDPGGSAP
jgi:hypothetical protein